MTRIKSLHRVAFCVPDLRASEDFYSRIWGMQRVPSAGPALQFRSREAVHADILLYPADKPALHHVAFSVADASGLRELLEIAEAAGARQVEPPTRRADASAELSAAFSDPDGNRIELVLPSDRALSPSEPAGSIGPRKLGHVVLWTPQRPRQEAFYAALGFQVTDRTHAGMSFMRCNRDHHTLALVDSRNGRIGAQHTSFDVGTIDHVMREFARLRAAGVPCIWGVGRHGPGRNVFSYYQDPDGNVLEFYGDMDEYPEAERVEPVFWGPEHKGDVWGVAGPPPTSFTQ